MTQTTYTTNRRTCDRCGFVQEKREHDYWQGGVWGTITCQDHKGSIILTSYKADLCADCTTQLQSWFARKPAEILP